MDHIRYNCTIFMKGCVCFKSIKVPTTVKYFGFWFKNKQNTMDMSTRTEQLTAIQKEAFDIFVKKNKDYGDAFATYGVIGVLMRIEDKIQRCVSITKTGINLVHDETLRDTLLDLHNYAAMALMVLDE